jgi:hypothetical protein
MSPSSNSSSNEPKTLFKKLTKFDKLDGIV